MGKVWKNKTKQKNKQTKKNPIYQRRKGGKFTTYFAQTLWLWQKNGSHFSSKIGINLGTTSRIRRHIPTQSLVTPRSFPMRIKCEKYITSGSSHSNSFSLHLTIPFPHWNIQFATGWGTTSILKVGNTLLTTKPLSQKHVYHVYVPLSTVSCSQARNSITVHSDIKYHPIYNVRAFSSAWFFPLSLSCFYNVLRHAEAFSFYFAQHFDCRLIDTVQVCFYAVSDLVF